MGKKTKFDPDKVEITLYSKKHGRWSFGNKDISGTIYEYRVTDHNFGLMNRWTFQIRAPEKMLKGRYIEVKPIRYPQRRVFANIDRRTLNFGRATKEGYRKHVYAKVALADVTGERTKLGTRWGDRSSMPRWLRKFPLRLKRTVTTTKGLDEWSQVAVTRPENHKRMIRLFLATKAWVLYTGFRLPD